MRTRLATYTANILLSVTVLTGATEKLLNGDFESWDDANSPTSWTHVESITQETTTIHGGSNSAKHVGGTKDLGQTITGLTGGNSYDLVIWYKVTGGDGSDARIWSYWKNGGTSLTDDAAALKGPNNLYFDNNGGAWSQYSISLTAPASADGFYFEVRTYSGATVYWDDFSFSDVTPSDVTAPAFTATYPKSQSATASGFDVAVNLDEIGTAYFVVLADAASAPSSAQVKAGTDAADGAVSSTSKGTISVLAASTEYTGSASSLSASTDYDVYVVAQDDESSPNLQASPTKIDVSTTVAASSPTASTSAASAVDHESATLNGTVNANNASTTVTFEYGLTTGYGSTATAAESPVTGSSGTSVTVAISSLSASTTYHFRVKAVNSEGTTYGSDQSFTTSVAPSDPGVGDLYISEVVGDNADGTNDDDGYAEIYNNTVNTLDLTNVSIRYFNSNPGAPSTTYGLSGTISSGDYLTVTQSNTGFNAQYGEDADFTAGGSFYFNGGDDGVDLYHSSTGVLDQFNDNGSGQSPWTWSANNYFERTSLSDGAVITNWTEVTSGTGSPGTANDNSLPVELSVWKAISSQGLVKLFWTTDSEIENQGFIIERSGGHLDKTWNEIASFTTNSDLLGQGSTSEQNDYAFIDKQVKVGKSYSYRLSDVDYRGNVTRHAEIKVTVKDAGTDLKPSDVKLHKAFPNPFNPDVNLSFTLENEVEELSLEIYDIKGALVQTLSSGYHETGAHSFGWNGYDSHDNAVSSGVYMVRLSAGSVIQIQRVTLLR